MDTVTEMTNQRNPRRCLPVGFIAAIVAFLLIVPTASAGMLLDAGFKGVYENNITGSSADIGKQGDYYTVASVSFGGYKVIGNRTFAFLRGNAEGYLYRRYSDLDAAIIGVSSGIYKEFNSVVSASAILTVKRGEYKGEGRSSTAYGSVFNLKQQITPKMWIKESYEFEKNVAASGIFSYLGNMPGVQAGYAVTPKTTAMLGYSYLYRSYNDPEGFRDIFHTISFGVVRAIIKKVYLNGSYDRQYVSTNLPGSNHTNNIFSLGVSYSY